jgi:hypothetical protein
LGAGFKFDLGKKCMLLTQMDYLGGSPEFSQVETLQKNLWGDKIIADARKLLSQL